MGTALLLLLALTQPSPELEAKMKARLQNCITASIETFGEDAPEVRYALCVQTLRANTFEKAFEICIREGSEPCPSYRPEKRKIWGYIGAGAAGAAVAALVTALALSL